MSIPDRDPKAIAAMRERIFGEADRQVAEARARVIDTMSTGSGVPDALDALERAVERRTAHRIRGHAWQATSADLHTVDLVADFVAPAETR